MQLHMRYFAIVRETMGCSSEVRTWPEGTTASDILTTLASEFPRISGLQRVIRVMVNQDYAAPETPLKDGDEVAIIPPVSGGDGRFLVTPDPLDPRAIEALVAGPGEGAVVTFIGAVRDNARGKAVTALDYEAYPAAAEKMMAQIGDEIREQWGIENVAIHHRTGYLLPGEASVVIVVASAHRDGAFLACRHAIERIKQVVPVWKKEYYADGAIWVGSEVDYQRETGRM